MTGRARSIRNRRGPRGFTLVEAMMAALVVAIVLVGAFHAVGASGADQARAAQRAGAAFLGQSLLDEACAKKYSAAAGGGGLKVLVGGLVDGLGDVLDAGAGGIDVIDVSADRTAFTSVDDYAGLVDSPPHEPDGKAIAGYTGWSREVSVQTVSAADGWTVSATDVGAKRVTVTVKRGTAVVERRSALVVNAP